MTQNYPDASPEHDTKRLFFASPLDSGTLQKVLTFQSALRTASTFTPVKANWIPAERIHLTHLFIGDFPSSRISELFQIMESHPLSNHLDARIQGLGYFPDAKTPTVLYTAVEEPTRRLNQLHNYLHASLTRMGISLPEHRFTPHLTLARFPSLKGTGACVDLLKSHQSAAVGEWKIRILQLVESCLSSEGPTYKVIHSTPLYSKEPRKPQD
ncbi:MAG: RNA 2',3'-cyclic phosphodiesterase [Candidatus Sumerlaeia bacterium]|nr:RNA 2',3'-cyclic phosphodiesterase [Candidatus Sumerlaeia bacterium]